MIAQERTGSNVTTLELFFDLVFVFVITQLSTVLAHDLTWDGVGHVALMLGLIWFMYGGYAWLTNAIDVAAPVNRAFLLAGMCGYFVIALSVPEAFHGSGLAFGIGYVVVVAVHTGLFASSAGGLAPQAILRLAPGNLGNAALVLVGGAVGGTTQVVLWTISVVAIWVLPKLIGNQDFEVAPAHFVERHGLVIIVAVGESIVAVGVGASGLAVNAELVLFAVCGLLLSASLWWTYFGGDDERAEEALAALPTRARAVAALDGYGFAHYALLLGIVFVAVGLKSATGHAYDASSTGEAAVLAGGAALFLAGDVWFRRVLRIGAGTGRRAVAAVVVLATIPLGTEVAAIAQVAALALVIAAGASELGRFAQVRTS
ncbi:low temperature requirement protein A [Conexibacter woesei]|uniref:low temperature requirement protein A n=1 Tax=Conexibacter woesei TaxID=191495 RepID=UPI0003FB562D|nr:low temperature requirement protein A [Conexibacter woesei]